MRILLFIFIVVVMFISCDNPHEPLEEPQNPDNPDEPPTPLSPEFPDIPGIPGPGIWVALDDNTFRKIGFDGSTMVSIPCENSYRVKANRDNGDVWCNITSTQNHSWIARFSDIGLNEALFDTSPYESAQLLHVDMLAGGAWIARDDDYYLLEAWISRLAPQGQIVASGGGDYWGICESDCYNSQGMIWFSEMNKPSITLLNYNADVVFRIEDIVYCYAAFAVDQRNGNCWVVADEYPDVIRRLYRFDMSGNILYEAEAPDIGLICASRTGEYLFCIVPGSQLRKLDSDANVIWEISIPEGIERMDSANDGGIWLGKWEGSNLYHISSDGVLIQQVHVDGIISSFSVRD